VTGAGFDVVPVNVLTGFLGSGKTTLLRRLLSSDLPTETAVLINEFGEVGIDHLLVGEIAPDVVLLKSGCVCCSIRGELKDAFVRLFSRRQKGEMPPFRRVMVETTGLADPDVTSFCLTFETQIDWTGFGLWLSMLLNRHGANILRVKGILNIARASYPVAVHGVQHLVHPPVHLTEWPDDDRRSRIVFIVRGLDKQQIERSFAVFSGGL
jgi:G3E family GTPase